jgi:uncharacterized tellurite resistance protein B-like protein
LPPDTAGPEQAVVRERCGRGVLAEAERVAEALARLGPRFRLPILSLALPALRRLDRDERAALLETLDAVVRADRRVTLAEFVIVSVVRNQISERTPSRVRFQDLEALHTDCALVLSLLTQAGGTPNQARARVYTEAMGDLGVAGAGLIGVELIELADVEQAMARLAEAAPRLQARIIEACARVVLADAKISVAEGELLRAVALAMGCPLPPIIDAHPGSGLPQSADKAQAAA